MPPRDFLSGDQVGCMLESAEVGPMSGYPLLGVSAILTAIETRDKESSEMAFKVAAAQAFRSAVKYGQIADARAEVFKWKSPRLTTLWAP